MSIYTVCSPQFFRQTHYPNSQLLAGLYLLAGLHLLAGLYLLADIDRPLEHHALAIGDRLYYPHRLTVFCVDHCTMRLFPQPMTKDSLHEISSKTLSCFCTTDSGCLTRRSNLFVVGMGSIGLFGVARTRWKWKL